MGVRVEDHVNPRCESVLNERLGARKGARTRSRTGRNVLSIQIWNHLQDEELVEEEAAAAEREMIQK